MKIKHILVVGVLALIVVGCVLAAGCTSTTNNGVNSASGVVISMVEDPDGLYPHMLPFSDQNNPDGKVQPSNASGAIGAYPFVLDSDEKDIQPPITNLYQRRK